MPEEHKNEEDLVDSIRDSYDRIADEYARRISGELKGKPLDRELLERFAREVSNSGEVCDLGCGPGHVARYLRDIGVNVFGMDISSAMLEEARRRNPDTRFERGNMLSLPLPDSKLSGIVAFYSICNLPSNLLPLVFKEMRRVLNQNGLLLLSFHVGDETLQEKELWGKPISMNFYLYETLFIRKLLPDAGFEVQDVIEREPYAPDVEYQSRRAYIFARKSL
jgi:ubiquinone/menaquinone biosynthesis C-methylase UbiE